NYDRASNLIHRAISINERLFGKDHPHVASALEDLAEVYWAKGEISAAQGLMIQSLNIKSKAFGGDDPFVISTIRNIALLDADQNDLPRSLQGFRVAFLL